VPIHRFRDVFVRVALVLVEPGLLADMPLRMEKRFFADLRGAT
jgi:hypothetical protein